jgi:hypothetical protein
MHLLGIGALQWPTPVTIVYRRSYILWGLASSLICSMIAFVTALYGWRSYGNGNGMGISQNSSGPGGAGVPSQEEMTANSRPQQSAHVPIQVIQSPIGTVVSFEPTSPRSSNANSTDHQSQGAHNNTRASSRGASCCDKDPTNRLQRYKYNTSVYAQLLHSINHMNLYFIVGGIILSMGSQMCHSLLQRALPPSLSPDFNVGQDFLIAILSWILFVISLLLLFYFFPSSSVRFIGTSTFHHDHLPL